MAAKPLWKYPKALYWAGLALGWGGILLADKLATPWREIALAAGWVSVVLAWVRVSPCANGACSIPAKDERPAISPRQP